MYNKYIKNEGGGEREKEPFRKPLYMQASWHSILNAGICHEINENENENENEIFFKSNFLIKFIFFSSLPNIVNYSTESIIKW
jgi:hypothetical protein